MVWSRQLETEIILPSDATPGPGSGVFYIGPNLPAEMEALGYTSAIIWYSDAEDYANSHVEYQFIGYRPSVSPISTQAMDIVHGMKRDGLEVEETQVWEGAIAENPIVNIHAQFTADDSIPVIGPKLIKGALNSNATDVSWTQTNDQDDEAAQIYGLGGILSTPFAPALGLNYRPPHTGSIEQSIESSLGGFGNLLAQFLLELQDVSTFNEFSHILLKILQNSGIIELSVGTRNASINVSSSGINIKMVTNDGTTTIKKNESNDGSLVIQDTQAKTIVNTVSLSGLSTLYSSWINDGDQSYLTDSSPDIDEWLGPFDATGTISGNNYTSTVWYRLTFDRIIDVRGFVVFASTPTSQSLNIKLASQLPAPDIPPGFSIPDVEALIFMGSPTRTVVGGFIQNSSPVQLLVRGNAGAAATGNSFFFQAVYTMAKP